MNKISITARVDPVDARVCAFVVDRPLVKGSALCRSASEAGGSPLFERLFALPGVAQVWAAGERVTVAFDQIPEWETTARRVGEAIRSALAQPGPPVRHTPAAPEGEDLAARVREVLAADVNPGLAAHGGRADLVDVVDGEALVRLSGGCQGCGAARMTLSFGIERTLLSKIPQLRVVRDVTDHAQGDNPFYSPGSVQHRSPFPR